MAGRGLTRPAQAKRGRSGTPRQAGEAFTLAPRQGQRPLGLLAVGDHMGAAKRPASGGCADVIALDGGRSGECPRRSAPLGGSEAAAAAVGCSRKGAEPEGPRRTRLGERSD